MKLSRDKLKKVYNRALGILGNIIIILLVVALIIVGIPTVFSLVYENNEAAPITHNAVDEFIQPSAGENNIQSGPYWYYQYATDSENPDWTNCTRGHGDYWRPATSASLAYMGISRMGKIQINNFNGQLDRVGTPSVAYAFVTYGDGEIIMNGSAGLISTYEGYSPKVRITVNNEAVYPQDGWLDISAEQSVSFNNVSFQVNSGDTIRFEMSVSSHLESGCEVFVTWNPSFIFIEDGMKYTQTNDIYNRLTAYMNNIFRNTDSETMDDNAVSIQKAAEAYAQNSQYGLYTPLNAIYNSTQLLPSDETSVWKFAVLSNYNRDFYTPNGNLDLTAQWTESGLQLSWENESSISEICFILQDGTVQKYTASQNSINVSLTSISCPIKVQVSSGNVFSEILTVYEDCDKNTALNGGTLTYLNNVSICDSSKSYSYFKISDTSVSSTYRFYYSTQNSDINNFCNREICFYSSEDEAMRFGFTAPFEGEYEISAPITIKDFDADVTYSVLKQSTDGKITALKSYCGEGTFCHLQVFLSKGDTVWFEAESNIETEINIGIPHITLKETTELSDGSTVNVYRAVDYIETSYKNSNISYNNNSSTENSVSTWDFGYFNNPVSNEDSVMDYDTLKLSEYAVGTDASALESLFTPYELIRNDIYNALPVATKINGDKQFIQTGTYGVVGNLYAALGNTYADRQLLGNPYRCKGLFGCTGITSYAPTGEDMNIGIFMRYNAPVSGNAELHLSDEAYIACDRILVIKNGIVNAVFNDSVQAGAVIDLGFLNKGDTVTLCYVRLSGGKRFGYCGMPYVKIISNQARITLVNSADEPISELKAPIDSQLCLGKAKEKIGQRFIGWYDTQNKLLINVGEKLSVTGDTVLTAEYSYYGDINSDGDINATDISSLRKNLIGVTSGLTENGDVNADGSLDILDLVRMKKWLAGTPCLLGK
ncbi:MAG: dockerin type I repeat-containing protein [Acutalibacteraceae bacterium]